MNVYIRIATVTTTAAHTTEYRGPLADAPANVGPTMRDAIAAAFVGDYVTEVTLSSLFWTITARKLHTAA